MGTDQIIRVSKYIRARVIFRCITGRSETDLLVSRSAKQEVSGRWVAGLLERGESRLQWCRAFTDAANHAMRAAFAPGGYAEIDSRHDFCRHVPH